MKVDEVIHLALMYAIYDRRAYADAVSPPPDYMDDETKAYYEENTRHYYDEAMKEIEAFQKLHYRRYGWVIPE